MGTEPHRITKVVAVDDFVSTMKEIHTEVTTTLSKAQDNIKHYANLHCLPTLKFKIGDEVLTFTHNHFSSKLVNH